jgi:hypothetical protein
MCIAAMAVRAGSAGNIERQDYSIADFNTREGLADFVDDAHDLVADHRPFVQRGAAVVHVQVAAADSGRRDASVGCLIFGLG